jgi:predicted dehydrogenase
VQAAKTSPRLFAVHENHRYRPWFQKILALHRDGFFGTPRLFRLEQHDATEPPEPYKLQTDTGIFLEYGSHLVDMTVALFREPERVYARLHRLNPRVRGESQALVVYEYPQMTALIDIAWKTGGVGHGSLLLEGDTGVAYYQGTMARGASSRFRLTQGATVVTEETRSPYDDYVESFYLFERECVDCMLTGKPVTQSGPENLTALTCTFAAYAAAAHGQILRIADFAGVRVP